MSRHVSSETNWVQNIRRVNCIQKIYYHTFHAEYYIPAIKKLELNLPHVKILGENECGLIKKNSQWYRSNHTETLERENITKKNSKTQSLQVKLKNRNGCKLSMVIGALKCFKTVNKVIYVN